MKRLALALTLAAGTAFGGSALAPLPAAAGDNVMVFQVNPTTRREVRSVRRAIVGMAVREEIRTNGLASGIASAAQMRQGSIAVVQQHGSGHTGSITQTGRNNAYGLFQYGQNTTAHVTQQGYGQAGMTVIVGN